MQRLMIRKPKIYERMSEASFTPGVGMTLFITLTLYIVYFLLREVPANIIDLIYYSQQPATTQEEALRVINEYVTAPGTMLVSLALTAMLLALTLIYVRRIEKRPFSTIGFVRPAWGSFAGGYAAGLSLFVLAALPAILTGTFAYKGFAPVAMLFIFAYIIQAITEEVFFRGYVMSSVYSKAGAVPAAVISSAMFALLNVWDHGASGLMIPGAFISGLLYAFITLRTGSIWAAAGVHAAWNFTYGLVLPVSMNSLSTDYSAFTQGSADVFTITFMAVCTVASAFVLFYGENRLAVPLSEERRMYLEARKAASDAFTGVRGDDGVPLKKYAISVAAEVQSDEAKAAAMLYVMRQNGMGFEEEQYNEDVLEAVRALAASKGVSKNPMALELRTAAVKCRNMLKERYKKYAINKQQVFCPLLRRDIDEPRCFETIASVDGGDRQGLFGVMDLRLCSMCSRRYQQTGESLND